MTLSTQPQRGYRISALVSPLLSRVTSTTSPWTLPPFTQDVVCPTKADLLHANVREAYSFSSFQLYVLTVKMQSVTTGGGQRAVLR